MDTENILLNFFVIFAAAKLSGEIFHRLHQPVVIGELLAGVVLGGALGWIELAEPNESLAELGAVVLMFMIGLDTHPRDIRRVGGRSFAVAAAGIALPFLFGGGYVLLSGGTRDESMFVAAAMAATSVGITARVLNELGVLHEIESRIILGAAIIDDILALILLAIVNGSSSGDLSIASIAVLAFGALALVGMVGTFGPRVMAGAAPTVERARALSRGPLVASLALCLGLSALAGTIGLAAIVGAFLAGMALSEVAPRWSLEEQVEPVYELLTPFFFVITGAHVDPTLFAESRTLGITLAVTGLAIAGKLAGSGGAAFGLGRRSMGIVGVGMVPRGEVGIIVASVGLAAGAISTEWYGVIVAMSILTTLITPPLLKALFGDRTVERPAGDERRTEETEGI